MKSHLPCCPFGLALVALVASDHQASADPRPDPDARLGKLSCEAGEIAKFDGTRWVCAQDEAGDGSVPTTVPFFVQLDIVEDHAEVLVNGPLALFATCRENLNEGIIAPTLVAVSSVDGWWMTPFPEIELVADGHTLLQAVRPLGWIGYTAPDPTATGGSQFRGIGSSAIAPDGSVIGVLADSVSFGIGIYGRDCTIAGLAFKIKGEVAP